MNTLLYTQYIKMSLILYKRKEKRLLCSDRTRVRKERKKRYGIGVCRGLVDLQAAV